MRGVLTGIFIVAAVGLAGCSDGLRDLRSNDEGPEEFDVLPVKPLSPPTDYSSLPTPTPGGRNLVDPTPNLDAVVALGGTASAATTTSVSTSDTALLAQTRRYGVDSSVRGTLAEADEKFRTRQNRFSRFKLFPVDRDQQAYRREALDPFEEAERYRRAGFGTPTSPPE